MRLHPYGQLVARRRIGPAATYSFACTVPPSTRSALLALAAERVLEGQHRRCAPPHHSDTTRMTFVDLGAKEARLVGKSTRRRTSAIYSRVVPSPVCDLWRFSPGFRPSSKTKLPQKVPIAIREQQEVETMLANAAKLFNRALAAGR